VTDVRGRSKVSGQPLTENRDTTPTFAGVLAFLTVGFHACTAQVLYRHPRFSGILPEAMLQLEQRTYNEESHAIQLQPSTARGLVERLNFVKVRNNPDERPNIYQVPYGQETNHPLVWTRCFSPLCRLLNIRHSVSSLTEFLCTGAKPV
jgi:hypothetical protein